ncbi:hypothetical protein [Caballeronia sp. dw_19]|uniref:hypothetical protein n=1 Tax=Caballeronia sp. dw_19 TaxID=2719791 RepID=UPI001BD587B3|nr:hypothetical protein [Caballeronia sp. dw_19]
MFKAASACIQLAGLRGYLGAMALRRLPEQAKVQAIPSSDLNNAYARVLAIEPIVTSLSMH